MDDDVATQPARNNLRYRRVVLANHLFTSRPNDRLGGIRERASDDDLADIEKRAHHK